MDPQRQEQCACQTANKSSREVSSSEERRPDKEASFLSKTMTESETCNWIGHRTYGTYRTNNSLSTIRHNRVIHIRTTITIKLPVGSHFLNLIQIQIRDY